MNKKKLDSKDMYGKKVNNGKQVSYLENSKFRIWIDLDGFHQANNEYGKMYKMGGKNNKGMNFYEKKKPSSYKMSKFEQMKKPPPPKKMVEKKEEGKGYEDESYDMGDNEHAMPEEDHGYDMGDASGMVGHDLGGEYDQGGHELAYDDTQGLPQKYVPQEVAYAALGQEAGYAVLEDQSVIPMTEYEGHDLYWEPIPLRK